MIRQFLALVVAGGTVLAAAPPVAADPAEPTEYRSEITEVDPRPAGFSVAVVGGDSFLEVRADPGHEVVVHAYSASAPGNKGEPFLRIRDDGTVEENRQSPYTYQIADRFAAVDVPDGLEPAGPPEWVAVGDGGVATWHDHRIHWMSPSRKPGIRPGDVVQEWKVDLEVDGTDVAVAGRLVLVDGISPLPWFALAAVLAALGFLVKRRQSLVAAVAATVAASGALLAGWAEYDVNPAGSGASSLLFQLPALGVVAGVAAIAAVAHHRKPIGTVATLASVAATGGWVIQHLGVLLEPVLPTSLPDDLDRALTAAALGLAVAAGIAAVRSGGLLPAFDELSDDDPDA